MRKISVKDMLLKLYTAFSQTKDDQEQRCSYLIQAVGLMDRVCGSLQIRQRQTPNVKILPEDAPKIWDRISKLRARALSTTWVNEKETCLRVCLAQMEKMTETLKPPKLADFINILQAPVGTVFASKKVRKPRTPRTPRTPGTSPDHFRPGSTLQAGTDILLAQSSITLTVAMERLKEFCDRTGTKCTNLRSRITICAHGLRNNGKIVVRKVNGETVFYRVDP